MQMSDNCSILTSRHLFHVSCLSPTMEDDTPLCPMCRLEIEEVEQKTYAQDRQRIVECPQLGGDWKDLAHSLNVNYKTAYGFVRSVESSVGRLGGYKAKYLNGVQMADTKGLIETDSEITCGNSKVKFPNISKRTYQFLPLATFANSCKQ